MRRDARHRFGRWTASGLAVVGLLTAGLAGTAGAAWADEGPIPVTFTGPDHYDLSLDSTLPPEGSSFEIGLQAPGEDWDGDGVIPPLHEGEYTVTIDASGLKGVADVRMEAGEYGCDVTGLVAVCDRSELYSGSVHNLDFGVALAAADGSAAGDHGTIKVTGKGDGLTFTEHTVDVLVGAPAYHVRRLHEPDGFQAGDTYPAPLAFRNVGGLDGRKAVLRVLGTRGLTFPQEFSNCQYGVENPDNLIHLRHIAVCTFDGTFEVGQAYRLSTPMKVKTAGFALRDILSYHFSTEDASLHGVENLHQGDGPALTLKKAGSGGTYAKYSELDFPTHNTYDLDLTGDRVDGAKGETVTAKITLTNSGPAWLGSLHAGGEPISFTVDVPEGATVTDAPDGCSPKGPDDVEHVDHYLCFTDTPIMEKDTRTFAFGLHIDEVVKGAKGRAHFPPYNDPAEGDPSNDDGWIVLNGTGEEETPGDGTAGSGGTTGGTTGGDTGSATGGGTASDGGTGNGDTGGTGGGAGPNDTGDEDGALAMTGSDALALGGLAAVLLAGGAAVTLAVRRRRDASPDEAGV